MNIMTHILRRTKALFVALYYLIIRRMRMKNKIIYLETSAVNYLASVSSLEDAKATRQYHAEKKNKYMISVVTLWEILMTSDDVNREKLIFYSQNALFNKLIFSPSELIINFINEGCPNYEPKKSIYTNLQIGEVWEDICGNNKKTLNFDKSDLKVRTKTIRTLFKRIDLAITDITNNSNKNTELKQLADTIYQILSISKWKNIDKDTEKIFKLSIIFISTILCAGVGFDNTPIENFWKTKEIDNTCERIAYIFKNYEVLVYRGPFLSMALMAYNQIQEDKRPNRGLFWDALHSLYLPYVDLLLTKDKHFKELQKKVNHINYLKIKLIREDIIKWKKLKQVNKNIQ